MHRRIILAALVVATPVAAQPPLLGPSWRVEVLGGEALAGARLPELRLRADARAQGTTGCNRFDGGYSLDGPRLELSPLAVTRRACSDVQAGIERRFLAALELVRGWRLEGSRLKLTEADGAVLMELSQAR